MLPFVIPAASSLISKGAGALFANKKDPQRVQAAQDALTRALAGDQSALTYMQQQAVGSATQVGKDAFKAALAAYAAQRTSFTPPVTSTPLQQVVSSTLSDVGRDLSTGVQQIGAGATNTLSNKLSAGSGIVVPFDQKTLLMLAAVAAAIILFRK